MQIRPGVYDSYYYPSILGDNSPLNIFCAGYTHGNPNFHVEILSTKCASLAYYNLEYVTEGKGYIEIAGETFPVKKGDFFLIRKSTFWSMHSDKKEPLKKYFINISGALADGLISGYELNEPYIIAHVNVCRHFENILNILGNTPNYNYEDLNKISIEIMGVLHKVYLFIKDRLNLINFDKEHSVEDIMIYVDANISRKITLEELCKVFFIEKTKLWRIFKEKYGISPNEYIQSKRIEKAKYYLLNTNVPISIIHEYIGLCDSKYFSRLFKSHTGMSPKDFRSAYFGLANMTSVHMQNWELAKKHRDYNKLPPETSGPSSYIPKGTFHELLKQEVQSER